MLTTQTSPYSGVCEKFVDNVMRFENLINPTTPRVMGRWAAMIINQIGNDLSRAEERSACFGLSRREVLKQTTYLLNTILLSTCSSYL